MIGEAGRHRIGFERWLRNVAVALGNGPATPAPLAALAAQTHAITGTMTERLQLLTALASTPPAKAVILCSAAASPDRGAERFLRQVCAEVAACALVPLPSPDPASDKPERWAAWLAATDVKAVVFCPTTEDAQAWLEAEHG